MRIFLLLMAVSAGAFDIAATWDSATSFGATGYRLIATNGAKTIESWCGGTNGLVVGLDAGQWSIHVVTESNGVEIGQSEAINVTIGSFPCVIGR